MFGNAFASTYLKLAYVDVSQDDVHWSRMPNSSLTPGPVGTFPNNMDASNILGLAGKYIVGYGTPFRLSEVGLERASYVRLVDVVGDGTNLDSAGNPIYDPYPNAFGFTRAASGFSDASAVSAVPETRSVVLMLIGGASIAIGSMLRRNKQQCALR